MVVEDTAGQGAVGRIFEEPAFPLERIEARSRAGVCVDTRHRFAAGYDLRTPAVYAATLESLDRIVGRQCLKALGSEACRLAMTDPRTEGLPLILETTDPDRCPGGIRLLRGFEASTPARGGREDGNGQAMRGLVRFLRGWTFRLAGTGAGVLFGVFGWRLSRSAEVAWYLLIYYPALLVSQLLHLGNDDRAALTATVLLYGVSGFLAGWAVDSIRRRLNRRRSTAI